MNTFYLSDHFQRYFDVFFANTSELLEHVYRIRYDVYCREFQYEREEDCPGGLEQDEYDQSEHSLHVLIIHKASQIGAGCVRMIRPPLDDPTFLMPMEKHCSHTLNHPDRHPSRIPRDRIAEISRLAVHTSFRKRLGEAESPYGIVHEMDQEELRTFPAISLGLFAAATALLELHQRPHMFAMMEPRLARRLKGLDWPFVPIGEPMDYHGLRVAYHVTVEECRQSWKDGIRQLYDFIYETLKARASQQGLPLLV
jgi:N-acyl amino acid synthase of PEP-CTERM/exosortase system